MLEQAWRHFGIHCRCLPTSSSQSLFSSQSLPDSLFQSCQIFVLFVTILCFRVFAKFIIVVFSVFVGCGNVLLIIIILWCVKLAHHKITNTNTNTNTKIQMQIQIQIQIQIQRQIQIQIKRQRRDQIF